MTTAKALFESACEVIPGGVNSPVRAFGSVDADPIYIQSAKGTQLTTTDGQVLTDFCASWGPLILGHANPLILDAINQAAQLGTSYGINCPAEVEIAKKLTNLVPSMDMVRLVNSGTEATMTALRVARGYTGRNKTLKFEGCYHGHHDSLLVSAGSGLLTTGSASSAGVSDQVVQSTLVCPYNDIEAAREIVKANADDLAAIIVEPVAGNMGLVQPVEGFLQALRDLCDEVGAVLIFDEVITGFRLAPTTYGNSIGIVPDMTCLGKIIGGGLPIGAVGGKREIMTKLSPLGPVYQAGTLSGNPVAIAAGMAMINELVDNPPYARMEELTQRLVSELNSLAKDANIPFHCETLGSMFTPFFSAKKPSSMADVKTIDTSTYAKFFKLMLDENIYLPPSQFEVAFVSSQHTDNDINAYLVAAKKAFGKL